MQVNLHNIQLLSANQFARIFFDFPLYKSARQAAAFGSSVNPLTGKPDEGDYVEVRYLKEDTEQELSVDEIVALLLNGKHVILLGEYGSGKSRCMREVFRRMAEGAENAFEFPVAIDLRSSWGLRRGPELLRRHFHDLGLEDKIASAAIRAYNERHLVLLLDGFDELGAQAWSNDTDKLRALRARALEGVKDLVSNRPTGTLICGREHYFNNRDEMLQALGMNGSDTIIIRCKSEFSEEEAERFFKRFDQDIVVPEWLPKRPLICQTIADLKEDEFDEMFSNTDDELKFFDHFMQVLCEREARIHVSFDAVTIRRVLTNLAVATRTSSDNVGPISLTDVQAAFEAVVGQLPVEEASVMLQRLPALGRIGAESAERRFIDVYILDGLRSEAVSAVLRIADTERMRVVSTAYRHPLAGLGQRLLANNIDNGNLNAFLNLAHDCADGENSILASDIIGAIIEHKFPTVDFRNLKIVDGNFIRLDLSRTPVQRLQIDNSIVTTLVVPSSPPIETTFTNIIASEVIGVTAKSGLPMWLDVAADKFDSVESVAQIRRIGLSANHTILAAIVRKTFFQKGSGRKEEALFRGLGRLATQGTVDRITNLLLHNSIITKFKGDGGWVYAPNRAYAGRMKQMLYDLQTSKDPIWEQVESF